MNNYTRKNVENGSNQGFFPTIMYDISLFPLKKKKKNVFGPSGLENEGKCGHFASRILYSVLFDMTLRFWTINIVA